ncbi:MAG: pirin family protein [Nitrospirota bacterium]|nr:pirin family protein [Nitrospirota bacterium]
MHIFRAAERGHTDLGWLDSRHSFSFGGYYDPQRNGFSVLRVLNDDRVASGGGFPNHGHRDMEIVSYVLEGHLRHQDSMGNGNTLTRGGVQYMSAGTGITHSEFNASDRNGLHFFQIWILPDAGNHTPRYGDAYFPEGDREGRWCLIASPDGRNGSVPMHQDACIYVTVLENDTRIHAPEPGRNVYVHVATGTATVNGHPMDEGDGAAIPDAPDIQVGTDVRAEVLLFDLP